MSQCEKKENGEEIYGVWEYTYVYIYIWTLLFLIQNVGKFVRINIVIYYDKLQLMIKYDLFCINWIFSRVLLNKRKVLFTECCWESFAKLNFCIIKS